MSRSDNRLFLARLLASVTLAILSAGCITLTNPLTTENRINRYLDKHPERPQAVKQALRNGTLCKGMTPQEVKFCWGSPNGKDSTEENGIRGEIWSYYEHHQGGTASDHGSSLFDYTTPLGRAVFTTTSEGLALSEWTIYGEEESEAEAKPSTARSAAGQAKSAVDPKPESVAPAFIAPEVTPSVDLSRWPALRVTGILKSGQSQVALINNTLVGPGDTIEGVTVVAVSPTGAYLRYGSETIVLTKGRETHPPNSSRRGFFK